ncbi:MAG TPA: ABC transporter permease [Streptosporangiaceae bacterium]|jgi:ABC-2 type transport system permease protein
MTLTEAPPTPPGGAGRHALADSATMMGRSVRHVFRAVDALFVAVLLPIMLLLVFVFVFGGAIRTGGVRYIDYVVPGVILLCAGYSAAATGQAVARDMALGVIDRFRSMPIARFSVLAGHVTGSLVRNLISASLVVAAALLLGWRPAASPLAWLAVVGVLLLYVLAVSWVSTVIGLLVRSPEAAEGFGFFMLFLPYLGSGFVPTSTMPGWLQAFADNQPTTPVTDTLRALLMGTPVGSSGAAAVIWCAVLTAAAGVTATILFGRRAR